MTASALDHTALDRAIDRRAVDPGACPVQAETTIELAEVLRQRLQAPDERMLRRAALWLTPATMVTGALVALGDGPIGAALAALVILVVVVWRLPHFAG